MNSIIEQGGRTKPCCLECDVCDYGGNKGKIIKQDLTNECADWLVVYGRIVVGMTCIFVQLDKDNSTK